uniref:hypothetical protein n=1 Tax=Pseudomonas sp. RW407 TaxID=2202894 RepID=UPI0011B6A72A|nr:hypothetical protein [Pseudomonas sp. RW407]
MNVRIRSLKGYYREVDGSLTEGTLAVVDVPGVGVCSEAEIPLSARRIGEGGLVALDEKVIGLAFVLSEAECKIAGIPIN